MAYVNCGVGVSRAGVKGRVTSSRRSTVVAVARKVKRVRNAGDELIGEGGKGGSFCLEFSVVRCISA